MHSKKPTLQSFNYIDCWSLLCYPVLLQNGQLYPSNHIKLTFCYMLIERAVKFEYSWLIEHWIEWLFDPCLTKLDQILPFTCKTCERVQHWLWTVAYIYLVCQNSYYPLSSKYYLIQQLLMGVLLECFTIAVANFENYVLNFVKNWKILLKSFMVE